MIDKKERKLSSAQLQKQLKECQKLKDEHLASWQRERADFLNYKKDQVARIGELVGYANIDLILKILPILDNFYVAEKELSPESKEDKNIKGLLQIKLQLESFLEKSGVEEIATIGQKFDPNFHEVVAEVESEEEPGTIIKEVQKGYQCNSRVIRPVKVIVSKFKI